MRLIIIIDLCRLLFEIAYYTKINIYLYVIYFIFYIHIFNRIARNSFLHYKINFSNQDIKRHLTFPLSVSRPK